MEDNILKLPVKKKHATDFFRAIKRRQNLIPLKEELPILAYDLAEEGLDKKSFPCFRLFKAGRKVGVIVVLNMELLEETRELISNGRI